MIFTFIPNPNNYVDRLIQLNSLNKKINVFVKSLPENNIIYNNLNFIMLPNKIYAKSFMLPYYLLFNLYKNKNLNNIIVIDWFKNFYPLIFFNIKEYIYSPVISDYGFIYKVFKQKKIICYRYLYFRLKSSFIDFFIVKNCNKLVVQSESLVDFYENVYRIEASKIIVNYNNYSQSFKIPKYNKKIRIGFVGNLELHKGLKFLIDCTEFFKDINFVLAGNKNNFYSKYYDSLFKNKNVEYLGVLNKKELDDFYKSIDVLLFPSFHEGSPRVVMEFIEYNKPIIYNNLEGLDYLKRYNNTHILKELNPIHLNEILKSNIYFNSDRKKISLKKGLYEYFN